MFALRRAQVREGLGEDRLGDGSTDADAPAITGQVRDDAAADRAESVGVADAGAGVDDEAARA